jgi:branched-chain amino acid transport system substrate-binding protein
MAESLKLQQGETPSNHAIFLPDDPATVAAIAEGLNSTPLKGSLLLGTNLLHNPNVPAAQLTALQGIVFPDAFFAGDPNPAVQKFIGAYRQQYGTEPDYLAAQGYVVLRLMTLLAESGQPLNRTSLPQQLMALKADPSLPWFKGFSPQREAEPALYLLTISGGGIQMAPSSPTAGLPG